MNKKGFVVSAVLYPLLVIFLALIMGLLAMSNTRKNILNTMKLEITDSIFDSATCDCEAINNAIKKHSQSILNLENRVSSIEGDYVTKSFLNSKIEDLQNTINNLSNRVSTIENNYVSIATMQTYVDETVGDKITQIENTLTSATQNLDNKITNLTTRVNKIESTLNPTIRLKVGDYVKMVPYSTSYTIPAADTGYSSDQTINPSELTTWIVIRNNGGTYDMVSEYLSSTTVFFRGDTGYRNYVGTLQEIATQYRGKYIISARMPNYKGQSLHLSIPLGGLKRTNCTSYSSVNSIYSAEAIGCGDGETDDDLDLIVAAHKKIGKGNNEDVCRVDQKDKNPCASVTESYWISNRLYAEEASNKYAFAARYTYGLGNTSFIGLYCYNSTTSAWNNCPAKVSGLSEFQNVSAGKNVRPIVTLGSQYYISKGDGSKNNPYVLE